MDGFNRWHAYPKQNKVGKWKNDFVACSWNDAPGMVINPLLRSGVEAIAIASDEFMQDKPMLLLLEETESMSLVQQWFQNSA